MHVLRWSPGRNHLTINFAILWALLFRHIIQFVGVTMLYIKLFVPTMWLLLAAGDTTD